MLQIVVAVAITGAVALLIAVIGNLIAKPSGRRSNGGVTVLRYGWKFAGAGVFTFLGGIGFLALFLSGLDPEVNERTFWCGVVLFGVLTVAGAAMVIEAQRRLVSFDEKGIAVRGWLGFGRVLNWADVIEVDNKVASAVFVVRTTTAKAKVSHHLDGVEWFIEECQRRLTVEVYGDAFKKPLNTYLGF